MAVYGDVPAQLIEEFNVDRQGRKPFCSAYYVSSSHEMVVHDMSKMIRRYAVSFKEDCILIVDRHRQRASDGVCDFEPLYLIFGKAHVAVRSQSYNVRQ